MKNLLYILLVLSFYSCKKSEINNITGEYLVNVENVRCSYYYCDTINYQTIFRIQYFQYSDPELGFEYFDSIFNFNNINTIHFQSMNKSDIVFSSGYTSRLEVSKETNLLKYYEYINNKESLEDTVSQYVRIESYKQ